MKIEKIFASLIIVVASFFLIWGAVLPWNMAGGYIDALRSAKQDKISLDRFVNLFSNVLNYPSPVGKEEVVKFLSGDLKGMVANQEESVARALVTFIDPHLFNDDVRHLLTRAEINYTLWKRFNKQEDFIKTAEAYQGAGKIGIFLPQPLYGLYSLFAESGQKDLASRAGKEILRLWPTETRIKLDK
jgi:hypothetical protein